MIQVRFEGGQELAAALRELKTSVSKRLLYDALMEAAEPIRRRMASLAPRSSLPDEHLADHIGISKQRLREGEDAAVAIGPTRNVFWGLFQEYGTTHVSAHPFARPAFDAEAPKALDLMASIIWRELAGHGVSRPTIGQTSQPLSLGATL